MLVFALVLQAYGELPKCDPMPIGSGAYSGCEATGTFSDRRNIGSKTLWIENCVFKGYISPSFGGVCRVEKGTITVSGTSFTGCQGECASCFFGYGQITVTNCEFTKNLRPSADPQTRQWGQKEWGCGCIGLVTTKDRTAIIVATITHCNFENNENGCLGQAKLPDKDLVDVTVTVKHCTFTDNHFNLNEGDGAEGGNCYIESGTHEFENCTFSANQDPKEGWAFYVNAPATAPTITLTECYFHGIDSSPSATIYLANNVSLEMKTLVTFSGNSVHIKANTDTSDISVTASGCVEFSNEVQEAVVNVTIDAAADVVRDGGQQCEVGPDPEEPSSEGSGGGEGGGSVHESDDPEPQPAPDPAQGKKLTGAEIAAIVIVLLIVIIVVVLLLFFLVFRRRYGRGSDTVSGATSDMTGTDAEVTGTEAEGSRYGTEFGLWESEAPQSDVNANSDSE